MGGETCEANCPSRSKNELLPLTDFRGKDPVIQLLTFFETTCYKSNWHLGGKTQFGPQNSALATQPSSPRATRANTIKSICHCPIITRNTCTSYLQQHRQSSFQTGAKRGATTLCWNQWNFRWHQLRVIPLLVGLLV